MMILQARFASAVTLAFVLSCSSRASDAPPAPSPRPAAHVSHEPQHGGIVGMFGQLHYELVRRDDGLHRFYLGDATRSPIAPGEGTAGRMRFVPAAAGPSSESALRADSDSGALVATRALPGRGGNLQVEVTVRGVRITTDFSAALLESGASAPQEHGAHQGAEPGHEEHAHEQRAEPEHAH